MAATPIRPAFAWEDVDQSFIRPKTDELGREMSTTLFADQRQISSVERRKGNSGYFLPAFFAKQLERTDEWARRQYEIYCDGWYLQGRSKTPGFVRAVCDQAIVPLISGHQAAVRGHVDRMKLAGRSANVTALGEWHRSIKRLTSSWKQRLEADARALEHIDNPSGFSIPNKESAEPIGKVRLIYLSKLTEVNVELEAQKQALVFAIARGNKVPKIHQAIRALSEQKTKLEEAINSDSGAGTFRPRSSGDRQLHDEERENQVSAAGRIKKGGRPRKDGERKAVLELRSDKKSWVQIARIMNKKTGQNKTKDAYRALARLG